MGETGTRRPVTGPTALLETKLRRPERRPGMVPRPRLDELLDRAWRSQLTLVSAPAGFGKTTLLAEWLASAPTRLARVAWVSLDDGDNDPTRLWTYVAHAVSRAGDGVGAEAVELLQSSPSSTLEALGALVNDLAALSTDLLLVLDDYHLVEAPGVHEGMRFLIDHQPPSLHLVLATRADPPVPLARLRAGGQLVEVRAADLRFTEEEAAAYLNGAMALGLSGTQVATLEGRTEGWIAALQLAALSIQGRDDAAAFLAGFAGDDRHVVDYLSEEVLARQPPDRRDFLLRTSILERLTGPLCDAVTGMQGGRNLLVALERANLFLVPLDDRREWYRYHHLFAEVLRSHLEEESPGASEGLHRRASAWLAEHGDLSAAVAHALAGGDPTRAADLMETAMPVLTRERREAELRAWVHAVPDEVVRVRPVLGVAFVGVLAQASDFDAVRRRLAVVDATLRPGGGPWPARPPPGVVVVDEVAFASVPARVQMYRAALSLSDGDPGGTASHARDALALAPADDGLTRAAAGALAGLASWSTGELAGAHAAYTQSIEGLRTAGFDADVLGCSIALGDICCVQGRLEDALSTYRQALDLAASASGVAPLRGTADMHVGIAGVLLERDDLAGAAEHLAASTALGIRNGLPQNPYRWRVVAARLREAEGDLDGALELLDEAIRVYAGDYSPEVRPVPAVRARLWLRRGEQGRAEAWVRERGLTAADEPAYLQEYEHVTLARVLLARHAAAGDPASLATARSLLDRLLAAAEQGGRAGTVIEVLILTALAMQAGGEADDARDALRRALALARPEGYVRLVTEEGAPMAALLRTCAARGEEQAYARHLLARLRPGRPGGAVRAGLVETLSRRELEVLRLLRSDLSGPDIARELYVSVNTLRTHTSHIYAKLGVTTRRAAVARATELELLPGRPR
jgi:LuxR family maltose regulon positive regulatory protein